MVLSALIFCIGAIYALEVLDAVIIAGNKTFFFLVSDEEHVEASAENVYLDGGAGYVLASGKNVYAVYACYFTDSDAQNARKRLSEAGNAVEVVSVKENALYLKTAREKAFLAEIKSLLNVCYSGIRLFGELAAGAESGKYTQESLKEILNATASVLSAKLRDSTKICASLEDAIKEAYVRLETVVSGIVFAKDLRYMQILLCDGYLSASKDLSL